jgi:beta-N-acetylhexosaminidase
LLPAGGLAAAIGERHPAVESIVIEDRVSDQAIADACERAAASDLVILGTVDALARPSIRALAEAVVATGVPVVAVALRAPWDADAYPGLETVLATYGIQAPTLAALATVLVGAGPTTGRLPVAVATAG